MSVLEEILMRKHSVRFLGVRHVFLDAEVMNRRAEVQCRSHAHGGKIRCTVATGAHMIERRKIGNLLQVGDAAAVHESHADVVDPLVADQIVRVPDRVENFADCDRRRGVFADDLETLPAIPPASGLRSRKDETAPALCPAARPRSASGDDGSRAADAALRRMSRAPWQTASARGASRARWPIRIRRAIRAPAGS